MDKKRIRYIVNKENRIVVATISECEFDAIQRFEKKYLNPLTSGIRVVSSMKRWNERTGNYTFDNKFFMNNRYKAIAKCHPDDEFDEEVGKKIAADKLIDKYEKAIRERMWNIAHYLSMTVDNYFRNN